MPNAKLKSYLQLHFIVIIWGFTAVLGKLISIEALPLVWYRMLIASALIFLFIVYKRYPVKVTVRTLIILMIAGVTIALHWVTFFMLGDSEKMNPLFYVGAGVILTTVIPNGFLKNRERLKNLGRGLGLPN